MRMCHIITAILLTTALPGCALFHPAPAKHVHKHAKATKPGKVSKIARYQGEKFVQQLALAQLGLPEATDDTSVIASQLDFLQAYSAGQPAVPQRQQVVILTLKAQNGAKRQVIAPVDITPQTAMYPPLLEIMNRVATMPYHIDDIRVATVTVAPPEALDLSGAADDVRQTLAQQQVILLESAETPPPVEEAGQLLPLIRFFISHRYRDAAYLGVDNVKRLLAQSDDEAATRNLSNQLDGLEAQLRKSMPY